jgi:hypothetical protein
MTVKERMRRRTPMMRVALRSWFAYFLSFYFWEPFPSAIFSLYISWNNTMNAEMTSRQEPSPNPKSESCYFFIPQYIEKNPSIELNTIVKTAHTSAILLHLAIWAKSFGSFLTSIPYSPPFFSPPQHFFLQPSFSFSALFSLNG